MTPADKTNDPTKFFFLLTFVAAIPAIVSGVLLFAPDPTSCIRRDRSWSAPSPAPCVYGELKAAVGLRLDEEEEFNGADLSIHEISAQSERD